MSLVYVARHGQASFGAEEYDQLTDVGLEQARALGLALKARVTCLDRAVCGTRERHRGTAREAVKVLGSDAPIQLDGAFDEFDHRELLARLDPRYADLSVLAAEMARELDPVKAFDRLFERAIDRWVHAGHEGGYSETYGAFCARCLGGLSRLAAALDPDATALVVTSGGPIAVLVADLLGLAPEAGFRLRFGLANAGLTKLVITRRGPRLSSFNELGHLEGQSPSLLTLR
jgi:broad specificity phosphatase PhoE